MKGGMTDEEALELAMAASLSEQAREPARGPEETKEMKELMEMGFSLKQASDALTANSGDLEAAIEYLFSDPPEGVPPETEREPEPAGTEDTEEEIPATVVEAKVIVCNGVISFCYLHWLIP